MYYRPLSNPLMVQPLPSAIVNSIRKTTVSALEKAHRDALDEVERLARSSNNKPGIEVWLSLWLLIFLYRDLLALGEGEMASVTTAAISQHQQHQHQQQVQRERAMWPHQLQTGQHVAPVGQNTWATLSSGSTPLLPLSPYPSPPAGFHQRLQPVQQQQQQPQQPQHSQQPQQRSIPATQTPQAASLTQHTRRLYEATVVLYRAIFRSRNMINSVAGPEALTKLGESSPLVLSIFDKAKEAKARFFRLERQNYPMEPFMHDMIVDHEHRVENRRPTQAKGSAAAASATGRPRMNRGGRAGAGGSAWIGNGSPPH